MTKQQKIAYYNVIKQALIRKFSIDQISTLLANQGVDETQVNTLIQEYMDKDKNLYLANTGKLWGDAQESDNVIHLSRYDASNTATGSLDFLTNGKYKLTLNINFVSGNGILKLTSKDANNQTVHTTLEPNPIASGTYSYELNVTDTNKYISFSISTNSQYMRGTIEVVLEELKIETTIQQYLQDNPVEMVEIEYGGSSILNINIARTDEQITQNGLTDQQVIDLVDARTAQISDAVNQVVHPVVNTVTNTVTIYNETAPITNNTVWGDAVDATAEEGALTLWSYEVVSVHKGGKLLLVSTDERKAKLYDPTTKTIETILTDVGQYGYKTVLLTWDTKRAIYFNNSSYCMQADRQLDGTYSVKQIPSMQINYNARNGAILYNGLEVHGYNNKVYEIKSDGTWGEKVGANSIVGAGHNYIYFHSHPDLKFGWFTTTSQVLTRTLQNDGTYSDDTIEVKTIISDAGGDINQIQAVQITLDRQKMVVLANTSSNTGVYKIFTLYYNGTAWEFVSQNNNSNSSLQNGGLGLSLDGKVVWVGGSNYKIWKFIQKEPQQATLDAYSTDPFGDGSLKHFYPLDSNVDNMLGGAGGTINGNANYDYAKYKKGWVNNNTDYVSGIQTDIPANEAITISCWASSTNTNSEDASVLVGESGSTYRMVIFYDNYAVGKTTPVYENNISVPRDGKLRHYVLTASGSEVKYYIDGELKSNKTYDNEVSDAINLYIGHRNSYTEQFKGIIDHVQIFDRVLTQEEINKLYNATIPNQQTLGADPANNSNPELISDSRVKPTIQDPDDLANIVKSMRETENDGSSNNITLSDATVFIDDNAHIFNVNTSEFALNSKPASYEVGWIYIDSILPTTGVDTTYTIYVKLKQGSNLEVNASNEVVKFVVRLDDTQTVPIEEVIARASGTTAPTAYEGWYSVDITIPADATSDNKYWYLGLELFANRSGGNSTSGGYDSNNTKFIVEDISWKVKQ